LQANTTYHYRIKSKDAAGNLATSGNFTFTTPAPDLTPPVISSVSASNITTNAATINWTTDEASDSQVEYGLDAGYGATSTLDASLVTSHRVTLSNLQANTTYHYRVKSKDAAGNLAVSSDFTLTTSSTLQAFDVTLEAENMPIKTNGDLRPQIWVLWENGYIAENVNFPDTRPYQFTLRAMGNLVEDEWSQAELRIDQDAKAVITVSADGLTEFTVEFTVDAGAHEVAIAFINDLDSPPDNRNLYVDWLRIQSAGSGPTDTQPPFLSNVVSRNLTTSSATINWTSDEASDSQVEYGLTASYGSSTPLDAALVISHSVTLSNLQPNTTYHYRVKSKDAAGNLTVSGDFSFTTNASLQGNVAFANVQDIFNNNCVRCHQGAGAPAELVLLPGQSRANIVNVPSTEYPQWQRVQPGNHAVSWLYEKISNPNPPVGSKMENLSADEIELIAKWIDQGAAETPIAPYVDLQFRTTALANAEVNVAYNLGLVVWGGLPPYQFSVAGGSLPPGLDLEPAAGMLVGTPTAAGSYSFTIRVSDSQTPAATLDQTYSIQVLDTQAHWQVPTGFKIENVLSDLYLPVSIAFVPNPGPNPDDPYFYVTLLYGEIVMVQRNFQKQTYASGLLNFSPTGEFPGSGEWGVTGITVDPASGDVFASMVYEDPPQSGYVFNKVERFHSTDGGRTAATQTTIFSNIYAGVSHQIQALTIGPDGKLYVNIGDGWIPNAAPDISDLRGKVLRMNLDGSKPHDNPFPDSYVYATGLRNPFGADWRAADGKLYISDNGPASQDRLAKILPGEDYGWRLESPDLTKGAIFLWTPTVSPVGMDFLENDAFASNYQGQLFVGLSGPAYWHGPTERGKKIQRFKLDDNGNVESESIFLDYVGNGKASVIGVTFGPDGLYFTDLYGENGFDEFGQVHGNIYRIRWVGTNTIAADVTAPVISQIRVDSAFVQTGLSKPNAGALDAAVLPTAFALQNYPNPFNAATRVRFALPQDSEIQLAVFDIGGRLVHELFNGSRPAGNHEVIWDGRNREGNDLSSGIYLVRLRYRAGENKTWSQIVQRVMMMK
jgi:glucose/arabinose dehydrogenase/mono/diheme cytochrome c family protein